MRSDPEVGFTAYVTVHRAELVRTAVLLTGGDFALAEDLVQTTLTKLYLAWPRIRSSEGPHPYARRVLANALIDERRRPWRRRERLQDTMPELPAVENPTALDELGPALKALPPRMRAAVVYRYLNDMSVAETAAALGCSEGTVKSQTARGLAHLRAALSPSIPFRSLS